MALEITSHRETQNEPPLTLGSLFDGIGVFPLAASRHGIVPLWASEIEKPPSPSPGGISRRWSTWGI